MKKMLSSLAAGIIVLGTTGLAQALTIDTGATQVGVIDKLIAETVLGNSGDAVELAWVQSVIGNTYGWDPSADKYEVFESEWEAVDGLFTQNDKGESVPYVYAHGLKNAPDYFMLKLAAANSGSTTDGNDHFLFENLEEMDWAVVSLQDMNFELKFVSNVGKVSHVGEFGGQLVPEPATMMLFGTGLAGLAGMVRRKSRKTEK